MKRYLLGLLLSTTLAFGSGGGPLNVGGGGGGTVDSVSGMAPIVSSGGADPIISCIAATGSVAGCLSATDWNTFNGKQNALSLGNLSSATTGLSVSGGTGSVVGSGVSLTIQTASGSQPGLLSAADWSTFNGKQNSLTLGNLVSGTTGVSVSGGTGAVVGSGATVSVQTASGSQPGLLSAADWTTFNSKQAAITPGSISTSTTGVTVGSGANSTIGPAVTVNVQTASTSQPGLLSSTDWNTFNGKQASLTIGNLTSPTTGVSISGGTGAIIGSGVALSIQTATGSQPGLLSAADWTTFNGKQAAGSYLTALTGDGTASGPGSSALTLATVNASPSTSGSASHSTVMTVNGKGLVTANTDVSIQIAESQVTNLVSDLAGKQATGNYVTALTGDVTASGPGSVAATIGANKVTNSQLAQAATHTLKGNSTGGTANVSDLSVASVNSMLGSQFNRSSFTFCPSCSAAGNVYTSWSSLWSDASQVSGTRFIYFNGNGSSVNIPIGTYNGMTGVVFYSTNIGAFGGQEVDLDNGVVFDDLPTLSGINLISNSSSPVISLPAASQRNWTLDQGAGLASTVSPMILIDQSGAIIYLKTASAINAQGSEAIRLINGGEFIIYLEEEASLANDSISDDSSGAVTQFIASASASPATTFSGFTGTLSSAIGESASLVQLDTGKSGSNFNTTVEYGINTGSLGFDNPTVTSASTYTMPNGTGAALIHATGTLTALTVKLPAAPTDGQIAEFSFDSIVTSLTVNGNGNTIVGTPLTTLAAAGGHFSYRYNLTTTNWWPR